MSGLVMLTETKGTVGWIHLKWDPPHISSARAGQRQGTLSTANRDQLSARGPSLPAGMNKQKIITQKQQSSSTERT